MGFLAEGVQESVGRSVEPPVGDRGDVHHRGIDGFGYVSDGNHFDSAILFCFILVNYPILNCLQYR